MSRKRHGQTGSQMHAAHKKATPAIRRATENLKQSLAQLQGYEQADLQQRLHDNCLMPDQQHALMNLIESLHQLAYAESLRDSGGEQQDMFSGLDDSEFVAWQRPMNQRTLF